MEGKMMTPANRLGYVSARPREGNNWHTPELYLGLVREVLKQIDLDPFSSEAANERVRALRYFGPDEDALLQDWAPTRSEPLPAGFIHVQTVFMNPPYSSPLAGRAVGKFIEEFNAGSFDEGVVLMNAATDTGWFHALAGIASALCFTKGRIQFVDGDGNKNVSGNTKGQCFFYVGAFEERFKRVFDRVGLVMMTTPRRRSANSEPITGMDPGKQDSMTFK